MTVLIANNVSSSLAAPISASATSMTVVSGTRFPVLTAGQYFYATIIASTGTIEIVKVTVRSGNAMNITRAQDGTNAQAFLAGARVEMRINAASVREIVSDQNTPLEARLTTAEGEIDALQAADIALDARLDTAEAEIDALQAADIALDARLDTAEAEIDVLQAFDTTLGTSAGSNSVGFLQSGTGATARTVQGKLRDTVSVKDFGAVGNGVADDTAAFQNAPSGAYVPDGTYLVSSNITGKGFYRTGSASTTGAGEVVFLNSNTQLNRVYSDALPVVSVVPPVQFNDTLKLQRYYSGEAMTYLQDPFDVIDFTNNPDTTINTYYVNFTTGNNANAGTSSGAAWKTLTYALTTAVSPAVIVVEDAWVGQNSLLSTSNTLNGKFKFVSGHASGRTLFTNMNESYTKATFNWLNETNGCWSTSTATTTATIFGRLGIICFDEKYLDYRGRAMPLPQAASAAACIATPGTQFLDVAASKKYVHLIDGRTPDPYDGFIYGANSGGVVFLQSANDGVILFENFHSYMNAATAPLAGFRYRHSTTATNASRFGARNCIACGASANGFEIYDADVAVLSNCSAAYNRVDNFNYHSFQSTGTRGEYMTMYEYNCDGLQPGYDGFINQPALSASSNSSTCHDSIHIERTSCNHGGGNGATIADVNGCVSVNWCINAGPPTGGSPKACFWTEKYFSAGTYNGMWLWGCSAHDDDDSTVQLLTNIAQAGGSANDGQIYAKYWRGKTDGVIVGTVKNFAGNNA